MITNDGKEIVSKYLLGQSPSFATHLSIGCGATPLKSTDNMPNSVYAKQRMDFEMTRVPISSKGFVDDSVTYIITNKAKTTTSATLTTSTSHDIIPGETIIVSGVDSLFNGQYRVVSVGPNAGTPPYTTFTYTTADTSNVSSTSVSPTGSVIVSRTKVSLTAELPTENKYDITEIAIWSAGSNNLVSQYDSRMFFNFSQSWQYHGNNTNPDITNPLYPTSIGDPSTKYGTSGSSALGDTSSNIVNTAVTMFAPTSDSLFQLDARKSRKEGPRHLNTTLLVRGDSAKIFPASGTATTPWTTSNLLGDWTATGTHIHLNDISFNISGNNASDLLKLAFSVLDISAIASNSFNNVKILMEFYKNESTTSTSYAKAQIYVPGASGQQLYSNRYFVASWQLSQNVDYSNYNSVSSTVGSSTLPYIRFYTSSDFSASEIRVCRIWVMVDTAAFGSTPAGTSNYYICFDGFRIDNTTENPTYKMSGYSIVKKDGVTIPITGIPITKLANTNNYIDFRFSLGVS